MTVDLSAYPRCAGYLRAVDRFAADSKGMTKFGAAIIIADALPEADLINCGFVWPHGNHDGDSILKGLERVLAERMALRGSQIKAAA